MTITTLDVVNQCLGTLGESPLNTLLEPHEFRGTAQRAISNASSQVQSSGWWFNTEAATLAPAPVTGFMQLPGDCLKWQSGVRSTDLLIRGQAKSWLVQRGTRLYDTRRRTFEIIENVTGEMIREVPFEELPIVMASFIASQAVLKFQSSFDADNSKRQELLEEWKLYRSAVNAEQTRQLGVNFINNNSRLQRIKNAVRRLR